MTDRISWDEYFYGIMQLIKERSVCLRRKVGALIVKNNQILCTGYNGPPAGHPHPDELGGCVRDQLGIPPGERLELCYCLHAEQNALLQAARHGTSVEGADMYVTIFPCPICARMIANSGIKHVKVFGNYPGDEASRLVFERTGVETTYPDISGFRSSLKHPLGTGNEAK
ncbi:MAG: dCMP deaminase family protein [bacterium]